ncbi:MAG TPA: HD domain-containing protein [Ktedonobacterales bacterium]|nr:HD domain-containing protein [Ktedonobacterales bacterium]
MKAPPVPPAHVEPNEDPAQRAETPVESLLALLDLCAQYMSAADLKLVRAAYETAEQAHHGVLRRSGEPFIEHPLAVARILAELAIDASGIAAALLHDTVEDTTLTLEDVRTHFGPAIAGIVDGVTKFAAVEAMDAADASLNGSAAHPQSGTATPIDASAQRERKARERQETVRKLFLAMGEEPRVVLLKLADRLHNLRTLDSMNEVQRARTARETLEIFAPLAGRIGLYLVKGELEDRAFSFVEPHAYTQTVARLADEEMKRAAWVGRMVGRMRRELAAEGIHACVNWRLKHPYRAWREARESGMDLATLHDLIAFRVLVETKEDCYQALRVIHHLWHPHGDRIRDYIATPKANGYQSFHTAVFALDGRLAQIHIRTHRMHRAAQHGVATFWLERAALGQQVEDTAPVPVRKVLDWVTRLASWHNELGMSAAEFEATVRGDLLQEEQVFVFTPKGHIRELPDGSTVLDLAYQIHTAIGDHATGAVVQTTTTDSLIVTRQVPVDYALRRGDVVRVLTSADAGPSMTWLSIARTRYAREKIGRALRKLDIGPNASVRREEGAPARATGAFMPRPLAHPAGGRARARLARCCDPCPGDAIAGVAGVGRAVTIHRDCCRTLRRTLTTRAAAGDAWAEPISVSWPEIQPITYRVNLIITGQDYAGLMHALSECAAAQELNVSGSAAYAIADRRKAAVSLTLDVSPEARLEQVFRRFEAVPGVVSVERDLAKGCDRRTS